MDKKRLYTTDYYNLRRISEEQKFIDLLNDSKELIKLITPSLDVLREALYEVIQGKEPLEDFDLLMNNENELNQILYTKLSDNKIFSSVKDESISGKLYTNAFNKLCRRIFLKDGHNDEKFIVQSYVHYWLENCLAKMISVDNRFCQLSILLKLIRQAEMLHHFYSSLKKYIPEKWITNQLKEWTKSNKNPNNVLESIRTFDKNYFKGYELRMQEIRNFTPWHFISETTRFSDHAMFNDEFSFKSVILFEKDIAAWVLFWDNLKLPILQDIPFHYYQYPKDILNIAKEIVKQKPKITSNISHLACILLKNLFESSLRVTERLSFYSNDERLESISQFEKDETIIASGKKANEEWVVENKEIYKEIINVLKEVLSSKDIEEWTFSYKQRSSPQNQYTDHYNSEIEIIVDTYSSHVKTLSIDKKIEGLKDNFSFQKFNFVISEINSLTLSENQAKNLLLEMTDFVESESFFWDKTYSPPYWDALKGIGMLLSLTKKQVSVAVDLINRIKVHHEGWNIKFGDYMSTNRESFMLCGIILLLEHKDVFKNKKERVSFFKQLLSLILNQSRFSVMDKDNDYVLPLHMLCLVVNQIYPDMKLYFEKELVQNLDKLSTVLRILSSEDYPMKPSSKKILKQRMENEIVFEKRKLMRNKRRQDLELLETSIEKLGLK